MEQILCRPQIAPATIRYRQSVFNDLHSHPELVAGLDASLPKMREVTVFSRSAKETDRALIEAIWRLGELEVYVELVNQLKGTLRRTGVTAPAFVALAEELEERAGEPSFTELERALPQMRTGLKLHRSVTLGINLDDKLRPVQATLLSVNDKRYETQPFLGRFFSQAVGREFVARQPLHTSGGYDPEAGMFRERLPLAPLFQELDEVLKGVLRPVARELRSYAHVSAAVFERLAPEVAFYVGAHRFFTSLSDAGFPLCIPEIAGPVERRSEYVGLYNLSLALRRGAAKAGTAGIVSNDLRLDDAARIYLLTGPNGGGKTTFTQALGIATLLAQCGLPVPATQARISPVDQLITHFPREEQPQLDQGHFEDEARRLSALFDQAGPESLVLLNEPFTSTGPQEAIRIARDVLAGLRMLGVRGLLTTHLHQLAAEVEELNQDTDGESTIGNLSAQVEQESGEAVRTFRIVAGVPAGQSYADDIARRHRIDLVSLRERIDGRGRT